MRLRRFLRSHFLRLAVAAAFMGTLTPRPAQADDQTGVILMAHGGSPEWKKMIRKAAKGAKLPCPHLVFLGMGDTAAQRKELQEDVVELERKGAHAIIVVPLLISSFSEACRQWKYLFGVDVQPGFINHPLFPLEKHAAIRFADPFNDSAAIVEILLDRAHEISAQPSQESVVIVAPGPSDETDHRRWSQILQNLSAEIQKRGGYATVEGFALRDNAPSSIRREVIQALRKRVEEIDRQGRRTLLVLYMLVPSGVEDRIGLELRGLNYALNTKTLLPDSRISEWIRSQVP